MERTLGPPPSHLPPLYRYHSVVVTCTNDPATFSPFVLHGDTVYFEFRSACSAGDGSWGFRFHASPVQGLLWLSEYEVLHACRFVGRLSLLYT